ncbi:hypothetical protein E2P81_ATG00937 [Venturia nashicola]|uniref:Uncharacterized protein n=1 Tax=Venturia nashicola TaxID=86259 RepID=A0A4Z1PQQ5_9PEZI|nr:hypothetical protein E6O75_ATG00958 [Venturia nashicola]TLD38394.1 hypothetical protein E2P81_ATG00937 [Venturia nashicola]
MIVLASLQCTCLADPIEGSEAIPEDWLLEAIPEDWLLEAIPEDWLLEAIPEDWLLEAIPRRLAVRRVAVCMIPADRALSGHGYRVEMDLAVQWRLLMPSLA